MTITRDTSGVYAIAPTPFEPDGSVDVTSLDRLVDFYGEVGLDGLTVLGQLGEAPKLDQDEAVDIARRVIGRTDVPVVVGVSAPGFAAMRSLTAAVMDAGAAGVMIAPPRTLRTDDQVVGYYSGAAQAIGTDVPFVIQDYPLTFDVQMTPGVIARIARDTPGAVMLKHEDWPGLDKISALRELEAFPDGELSGPLAELAEFNRANGALLARRRREVNWALRHLGRMESAPAYDASGRADHLSRPRELAVA